MNEARKAEIEQKLNSSREDLILDLGRTTTKSAIAPDLRKKGLEIYENLRKSLQKKICTDKKLLEIYKSIGDGKKALLVAALADFISGLVVAISPVTLAVLLVKDGMEIYCESYWKKIKED